MIGDVILIDGASKLAALNTTMQRMLSMHWRPRQRYMHVAMGFSESLALHAMPSPRHVELAGFHELLAPGNRWRVWRSRAMTAQLKDFKWREKLHYQMCSFLGGSYNGLFLMKDVPQAAFCSQLVGRIANDCGHPFDRHSQ